MARRIDRLDVTGSRERLEAWARSRTAPQRLVVRSRIVLMRADGYAARNVARALGVSRNTVDLWHRRFKQGGCDALTHDRPGRGRKPRIEIGPAANRAEPKRQANSTQVLVSS